MNDETKEIDLLEVTAYIFQRKLVIIISFILSLCLGLIYINFSTKDKLIYLNLDLLNSSELHEYSLFNFLIVNGNLFGDDYLENYLIPINSKNLGLLTQSIFSDRLIKKDIFKSNNFFNIPFKDDIQLEHFTTNFRLLEPVLNNAEVDLTGRKLTPYYQLRLKTSIDLNDQNYKDLFSDVLNELEIRVKDKINNMYHSNINNISIKDGFELDRLINNRNNLIDDFIVKRKKRLRYLEQNLAIAKAAEKGNNAVNSPLFLENGKINIFENNSFPYYFFGSAVIKQEIEEVKKEMDVTDPSVVIDGILSIESEIRSINQSNVVERINTALNSSPLGENNTFKVFSYDVNNLKYEYEGISNNTAIFLFGLVGIIFGFLLIFFSYLRKKIDNLS